MREQETEEEGVLGAANLSRFEEKWEDGYGSFGMESNLEGELRLAMEEVAMAIFQLPVKMCVVSETNGL